MSTKSLLGRLAVLAAPGVCWSATLAAGAPPQLPSPPTPAATAEPDATGRVVLLSDGRILIGELVEDGKNFALRQRGGVLKVARKQVEGVFDSIAEVYRHKVERVADDDPDEHRKLVQWCLSNKLHAEARAELERVIALAPNDRQARSQLDRLLAGEAQREARAANRPDPGVVRTAAEGIVRAPRPAGPPAVFDLPPALALKRYQEFGLAVHPELQRRCAGCHHERSGLPFQLVRATTPRELRDEMTVRTNLEAALDLIDRDDPARSPLLVSAILPHKGANNQPILGSAQHPSYRALAQWVAGVSSPHPQVEASPLLSGASPTPSSGGFASQRGGPTGPAPLPTFAPTPPSTAADAPPTTNPKSVTNVVRTGPVQDPRVPAGTQFPTPGLPQPQPGIPPLPNPNPTSGGAGAAAPPRNPSPTKPGSTPATAPGATPLDPADPALAPMADPTRPDPKLLYPPEFDKPDGKAKDKAKSKLNLDVLERLMKRDG